MEQRHEGLEQVSPEVGVLDESALAAALDGDTERGIAMLIDMARATDPVLRARARAIAARMLLPIVGRAGPISAGGSSRLTTSARPGVDLDLDQTFEQLAEHPRLRPDDLRWRDWRQPGRAYVLVVDASGSVTGLPLATAVVTAAALASRLGPGDELGVVAFWSKSVVLRDLRSPDPPARVLQALFDLRGGDTTDLAAGLTAGLNQAVLARATEREIIVLTDGMANEGDDPFVVAAGAGGSGTRIHVLGLSADPDAWDACVRLAEAGGGRPALLDGAAGAPAALSEVLGGRGAIAAP